MLSGSLQQKCGTYYAVVRIPDETGREKQKWISTGIKVVNNNKNDAAKREATKKLRKILNDLEDGKITYSAEILFVDWINRWMEQKCNNLRKTTLESYETNIQKHIVPYFEPLKLTLRKITAQHIQDYFNAKQKEGQSANSVHKHNAIIRGALQDAVKKNLIAFNPASADRVTLPKKERFVGKSLTIEQANKLLNVIDDEPLKPAIILGLFYGLRKSECLGLRWKDINFKEGTIHICNTVVRVKTRVEGEQTKSRASERTLFIIPETREYLLNLRRRQMENRLLMGNSYKPHDNICVWDNGTPFSTDYLSKKLTAILKANGIPHVRFHDLRHTAGSILLNKGLSAKQIQEFLGHEQISTTLDIYGHLSLEGKKETSNTMGSLLEIRAK